MTQYRRRNKTNQIILFLPSAKTLPSSVLFPDSCVSTPWATTYPAHAVRDKQWKGGFQSECWEQSYTSDLTTIKSTSHGISELFSKVISRNRTATYGQLFVHILAKTNIFCSHSDNFGHPLIWHRLSCILLQTQITTVSLGSYFREHAKGFLCIAYSNVIFMLSEKKK